MKKIYYCLLFTCALSVHGTAQQNLSANIFTGWLFPYNDLTETDYVGYKPNLAVGAGMGYNFIPSLRLRGDVVFGTMNGNNRLTYYETTVFEPQLGLDFDLLRAFSGEDKGIKLNLQGGTGIFLYTARLYDRATGARLKESPVRANSAVSPNAFLSYGGNIGIRLTDKLDLNLGYTNRYVFDAPWMDVTKSGDHTDHYGLAQVGFTFFLKSDRIKGTVEVPQTDYNKMLAQQDSLKTMRTEGTAKQEQVANLEMEKQEKEVKIRELQEELDSTKALLNRTGAVPGTPYNVATTVDRTNQTPPVNAKQILGTPRYRLVVASLPTQVMAQRWIDRTTLDKGEMVIAYIQNLNTYRVVYKSFDAYPAARKEQQEIKRIIPDAWIIEF